MFLPHRHTAEQKNWTIVFVGIKESIIASGKVTGRKKNTLYYE